MPGQTNKRISIGLILACVSAHAATVSLDPPVVEAELRSVITVSGHSQYCAPIISHVQATVAGTTLNLSAAFEDNPAADCLPGPVPYAADFPLPPLDSGAYTVLMRILPACSYSATPCPFAAPIPDTGRLYVQDPAASHYHVDPNRSEAGHALHVKITAAEFQCGSGFDSLSVEARGGRLSLGFQHHPHPEALCPGGAGFGPVFDLTGLNPGIYQVFATEKIPCDRGLCAMVPGPATFAGALVADTFSTRPLWVSPRFVGAGTPSDIGLGGVGFACDDSLMEKRAEVKDGAIHLHYTLTRMPHKPERCMVDTLFSGYAAFSLPALPEGTFPVFLDAGNCGYASALCASSLATLPVDTLVSTASSGLRPQGVRIGARRLQGPGAARVILPWEGRKVDFSGRAVDPKAR
ncbi:MAG: hypothetical protein JF616_03835 [Fibrobacteres bacterium]|nr:hypothetical protein [Fibrobacterota bacterium]